VSALQRLAGDPLAHFLIAGAALFAFYRAVHGPDVTGTEDGRTITVDRPALLQFVQYESMAFKPDYFDNQISSLSAQEKQDLIDKYVREQALFREASAMGLADGDYVIRRRLVQKMLYLLDDAATESFAPSEATLLSYFHAHEDRYRAEPTVTLTQVFLDDKIRRREGNERAAEHLGREMELKRVGFAEAPAYGDRFPYLQNYVNRTRGFIENQFGSGFATALAVLQPSNRWQGPIKSDYGYHLVLLTQREPARLPDFAQIREEVRQDLLRDVVAAYRETAIKDLTRRYTVRREVN